MEIMLPAQLEMFFPREKYANLRNFFPLVRKYVHKETEEN